MATDVKLNLGCGDDLRDGWHNVDIDPMVGPDEVYDLEEIPWPWEEDFAYRILMDNVFEHLSPNVRSNVLDECFRLLGDSGILEMVLPVPEVGIGWDVTHHPVPSWRWPLHPENRDVWTIVGIQASTVGLGRFLPERIARLATRFWIARCVDEVTIEVKASVTHD